MKVSALIELLQQQDPELTVVLCDRTDFVGAGLVRPLRPEEVETVQLGCAAGDAHRWLCGCDKRAGDCSSAVPGLLLGPR